jgi:hypothetical protein
VIEGNWSKIAVVLKVITMTSDAPEVDSIDLLLQPSIIILALNSIISRLDSRLAEPKADWKE